MRLTGIIETAFGTTARIAIIRRLVGVSQPLSARQLAELTGLSHRGVIQAIAPLVEAGMITWRQAGRAHQYQLSRKNIAVIRIILPIFRNEAEIRESLYEEIVNFFSVHAQSLVLFGSFARGDESNASDIDILAVVKTRKEKEIAEEEGERLDNEFRGRYSAPLSFYCLTRKELLERRHVALIKRVSHEGILLSGTPVEELMRSGKAKDKKGGKE